MKSAALRTPEFLNLCISDHLISSASMHTGKLLATLCYDIDSTEKYSWGGGGGGKRST